MVRTLCIVVALAVAALLLWLTRAVEPSPAPPRRIVHVLDWHYVNREDFALDVKSQDPDASPAEIDAEYATFLATVEAVQLEQMAELRSLIREHGVRAVFVEGVAPGDEQTFRDAVAELRTFERDGLPELRRQLAKAESLGPDAAVFVAELRTLLDDHRRRLLLMGAAGRLMITGELDDVLALEDAAAYRAANPIKNSGLSFDAVAIEAREDGMVRAMLMRDDPFVVCVLGGYHKLSDNLRRISVQNVEHVRVTPTAYPVK